MRFHVNWLSSLASILALLLPASAITWSVIDYPGSRYTSANGINSLGQIVGQYDVGATTHGFLLNAGTYSTIDFPGAISTYAEGINDNGEIVGIYKAVGGSLHGFLMQGGTFKASTSPTHATPRPLELTTLDRS